MLSWEKWDALVAAETEIARLRVDVNQLPMRAEVIERAVKCTAPWERSTALTFLQDFPEEVPRLLELLVDLCLSSRWAPSAREALWSARYDIDAQVLGDVVLRYLADGDVEDYRLLADTLTYIEAWPALGELIAQAGRSDDAEVREIGEELARSYRGLLP
ncbi:hypothetical protein G9272_14460 [Streptomyces asoensis]|uniref:HEAT repeat domain-containing protein n=1 Tax=Streptomyces asoensis TaxID=249586 RepID=A0A6M4WQ05_9ACTN|nr:hypothetical protein [Streptomyces asoensis]QJT01375.1 hypothetical protein G9272_14460 [Streptomyces asoensis]